MMATRSMDRFSELPSEILDKILGLLAIHEAAGMAILSTFWREMWFNLRDLDFDYKFFCYIEKKYSSAHTDVRTKTTKTKTMNSDILTSAGMYVVNKVLIEHKGHIRKFRFSFFHHARSSLASRSFDIDQWLLLITRKGVEEIDIRFDRDGQDEYSLPKCIFSCPTLKTLRLHGVSVEPLDVPCILPNATSLSFENVEFEPNDTLEYRVNVPMLESLLFIDCDNMFRFNITAPKLCELHIHSPYDQCRSFLPVHLDMASVSTLILDALSLKKFVKDFPRSGPQLQPHELNVERLCLSNDSHLYTEDGVSSGFTHLLKLCPKLREINMDLAFFKALRDCLGTKSENSKELYRVAETHNLLHTMRIDFVNACENYPALIKGLLSSFPTLVKFVIYDLDSEFNKKFLEFPTNVEMKVVNLNTE
ncbi:unnamed protein product [Cuscuta europaea]|uniref:F-box/LRR-repeat protein 15/At3g58940/PEG3-like LRR domain-containing protein n=1 Tax=Cuscuta europaea TaxID=41803 RepID=A0A9P1EP64_CUSEU|nr:unnamed protein product [Cuscuta europaea]